jgi:excisionase family DNA binding protein
MNAILKTSTASEIMTTSEVSDFLSVHRSTVHKMRERGDIVAYKFGKRVYFKRSEIMATITANRVEISTPVETSEAA